MVQFENWKAWLVVAICVLGVALAAPNLLSREQAASIPDWLPHKQVSLGLDLQGGAHLLAEVQVEVLVTERISALVDDVRTTLRSARILFTGLGAVGPEVRVRPKDPADAEAMRQLLVDIDSESVVTLTETGEISLRLNEAALRASSSAAVAQALEIIRRRVDETGTAEPTIQRQGEDRIIIQLPGVDDPDRIKELIGKTAKLEFRLLDANASVADAMAGRVPAGSELLASDNELDAAGKPLLYLVRKRVMVAGERLIDAQASFDNSNQPVVSFRFDTVGARQFGDVTTQNVGRPFAIVLDGKVISAPVIREAILGGSGIISGSFSVQTARDLALLLRAGALPAPLTVLEERTVGAEMGADSIRAGKIASVLAVVLVIVFMAAIYGMFGFMADAALVMNLLLIAAALSLLQATLTLPGIAGIVLTIGMAVDANVLIFERIREEQRAGRTPISAVDTGYRRALTTIIDANLTTLIAAILLFEFGSGPIKGFAVTLAIGLMTSMFTTIMLTRLIVVTWLHRRRPQRLPL